MKKILIGLTAAALVLGIGTAVYAAAADSGLFEQMLPMMKQMHPNMTDQQLQDMFNSCHSNGNGGTGMNGMMGSFQRGGGMMN